MPRPSAQHPSRSAARAASAAARAPRREPLSWRAGIVASLLVAAVVVAAFAPVLRTRALSLDDDLYVTENALVNRPSAESVVQFFREALSPTTVGGYWMPLSMTSLMLDVAQGGSVSQPEPFHRTSLALHVGATLALFWLLLLLFGAPVPAALAALVFGLHPLAVEPVAWIGERKTVLAGALALGAAAVHVAWVRAGGAWRRTLALVLFALALLSKPTALPLPLLLLLLDAWPLRRLRLATVVEKWPFALLAAVSAVISLVSHARSATLSAATGGGIGALPLQLCARLAFYAGKLLWPAPLACVYPDLGPFSWTRPALLAALAGVVALTALAIAWAGRRPALLAAWGWFVLALAPVLGLLHFSWVTVSDKYAYLALAGAALALAGALALAWRASASLRAAAVVAALALLGAEAAVSRATIAHWSDSLTLWRHIVTVSPGEAGAHNGYGGALVRGQAWREARGEFERAVALDSTFWMAHVNVAFTSVRLGDLAAAQAASARALALMPGEPVVFYQAAEVAQAAGRWADAERILREILRVQPLDAPTHVTLAQVLDRQGRREESLAEVRRALELHPGMPTAEFGLGSLLIERDGFSAEARGHLEAALRAQPNWLPVMNALAWGLATAPDAALRDSAAAVELATRGSALAGDSSAALLDTRAAAEAATGRFADAAASERRAIALAARARADSLAAVFGARLARYQHRQPWREGAPGAR